MKSILKMITTKSLGFKSNIGYASCIGFEFQLK